MARSCGIRIGPRRFELVVLDGNAKKHKITAYMAGELPRDLDDPIGAAAAVLKQAAKDHDIPRDNVGIAIDTGLAAFRTIKMPFSDRAKIEQVVKFEVESLLPQWTIDDVIVDFQPLDANAEASELLITAVKKQDLRRVLAICEKAGIEPLEAEIETTAMVNAALGADVASADTAQILVHIGEQSTSVVVLDGGQVREMRAIHIGALSHELVVPAQTSEVAEAAEAFGATAEGSDPVPDLVEAPDPGETQRRLEQAIKRIRRELGRTVSATRTVHPIESIHVCGFDIPGLVGSSILDVPIRVLDVFEEDGGQPVTGFGQLVVPYGVALRQLGGGILRPSLRREELRYTGAFERVELPLAVVCLLAVTLLAVWNIFLYKEEQFTDRHLAYWRDSAQKYLLGDPKKGVKGYLEFPSETVARYAGNLDADTDRNKFEQLQHVRSLLQAEIKALEKDLGQDAEVSQPQSALRALALVLDVLDKSTLDGARPSLRKVRSTFAPGRSGKPDSVKVQFDVTFFGTDSIAATEDYESFRKALEQEPWHVEFQARPSATIETGEGIVLTAIAEIVDVSKAPPVPVQ
jgi:Tfp pilus assembly PilM family ATPase